MVTMSTSCARRSRRVGLHLLHGLAQAEHDPGLGRHVRMLRLELLQQGQRPLVVGARAHVRGTGRGTVSRLWLNTSGGSVRQDLQRAFHAALAAEIRGQDLDSDAGRGGARLADAVDEMLGAAVAQVVAVDAGDDHVASGPCRRRCAPGCSRLGGVRRLGPAVGDVAEQQRRVQTSPRIMKVAVPWLKHSWMFGQLASSQTVTRRFSRSLALSLAHRVAGRDAHADPAAACAAPARSSNCTGERAILSPPTCLRARLQATPSERRRRRQAGWCAGRGVAHVAIDRAGRRSGGQRRSAARRACRLQAELPGQLCHQHRLDRLERWPGPPNSSIEVTCRPW